MEQRVLQHAPPAGCAPGRLGGWIERDGVAHGLAFSAAGQITPENVNHIYPNDQLILA